MDSYLIGIDGGGTKTAGRLARRGETLEIVAEATVGASNLHSNEETVVRERLNELIAKLESDASVDPGAVAGLCMGMAGGDRSRERALLRDIVAPHLAEGAEVAVVSDALTALAGGLGCLDGIMVIAGTGSISLGARGLDRQARAGGWGHILGDEGSGYILGLRGLRAVCRAHDGIAPETELSAALLGHLGLVTPPEIIGWTTERRGDKAAVAALSPIVLEHAEAGDEAAARIAEEEAAELALAAEGVRRRLFAEEENVEVVTGGGNLVHNEYYRSLFERALSRHSAAFALVPTRHDACHGALTIAALSPNRALPSP